MKIFNSILILCGALLVFVQCAKSETESFDIREQKSFELWMAKYHPTVTEQLNNGMFVEWLKPRNENASKARNSIDWLMVDYLGRDLNGNVISTRDSMIAKNEGTFTRATHYTPHYAKFDKKLQFFTKGEYEIFSQMSEGDSVRIYMPSMLSYGVDSEIAFSLGYEGWNYSGLNPQNISSSSSLAILRGKPTTIDIAIRNIIEKPKEYELDEATQKAIALGINTQDTIREGLFFRYIEEDTSSIIIHEDSVVHINYSVRFLDEKLFKTNQADIAYDEWGDFIGTYIPFSFVATNSSSFISGSAINELIKSKRIRYNSKMQIVFISDWAYGSSGLLASGGSTSEMKSPNPVLYPYTPLIIDIITLKENYGEEEEEEEEAKE